MSVSRHVCPHLLVATVGSCQRPQRNISQSASSKVQEAWPSIPNSKLAGWREVLGGLIAVVSNTTTGGIILCSNRICKSLIALRRYIEWSYNLFNSWKRKKRIQIIHGWPNHKWIFERKDNALGYIELTCGRWLDAVPAVYSHDPKDRDSPG